MKSNATITTSESLATKLHEVQVELHHLTEAIDKGESGLNKRLQELKEEFTGLMNEMRRRKSIAEHPNIIINIEVVDCFGI